MNSHTIKTLEFEKIKAELHTYASSGLGRDLIDGLEPSENRKAVEQRLRETTETRRVLDAAGSIPLNGLHDVRETLTRAEQGGVLEPSALVELADFMRGCRRLKRFMARYREMAPMVAGYAESLTEDEALEERIELSIDHGQVSSSASHRLAKIRNQMEIVKGRIKERINSYLTSSQYRDCLQETIVSLKDGRACLAVKAACRSKIAGTVLGSSGSGQTVFIEPAPVRNLANELKVLEGEEEVETYRVLAELTGEVAQKLPSLLLNVETMAVYDFACAKAKYSRAIDGIPAEMRPTPSIQIRQGRHPLIGKQAVPLNFKIGGDFRTLLITGPNTGGKTVVLKTVGLMVLMTQAGLHIPVEPGTSMGVFRKVLVDIGDQQSIEQSLSTFSGHVRNLVEILREADSETLVLIDEIGTGTDPAEGAAIAAAVLDDLYDAGAITVASTHYGDLKRFSQAHRGFRNGCMTFDPETLRPLYRLEIGRSGLSNGLWIAERLGIAPSTLGKARKFLVEFAPRAESKSTGDGTEEEFEDGTDSLEDTPSTSDAREPLEVKAERQERVPDEVTESVEAGRPYRLGDSVFVSTVGENGILCELADARGEVAVMVKGKRIRVNQKRITLHIPAEQLYPDVDRYDLDIVFLSKENRKLKKAMSKHHIDGKMRPIEEDNTRRM